MNDKNTLKFIALLTDFGTTDYFVGAMKGAILSISPNAQIIDITHDIDPQNINSASFNLRACYKNFPEKTIFVVVVDPGVGSNRKALLVETERYFFIAPDNGLLSFIFNEPEYCKVFELTNKKFFAENVSRTFHGRDVFAPVAAHLSKGVSPDLFGAETKNYIQSKELKPHRISETEIAAEIIYADHFGNLITNLTSDDLPENFTLRISETTINKRQEYFTEASNGDLFMIFGSAGFLEIVAFQDSAQRLLNARIGQEIIVANA